MRTLRNLSAVFLLALAMHASDSQKAAAAPDSASVRLPSVLQGSEPTDSVVVMLPGHAPAPETPAVLPMTEVRLAPPPPDPERPVFRRPQRQYPPEFEVDSAEYLKQQIGQMEQPEGELLLGEPLRHRPSYADDQTVNGQIYAYLDPTGRYKEIELDFDRDTGHLRTVFIYPYRMTWQECRDSFGANVQSAQANKGRTFYSYLDRHLDVLVDSAGKVISLGMY